MPTPEELLADATVEAPDATPGLNVLVEKYAELKARLDAVEALRKEVQQEFDALRKRHLPQVLSDQGLSSVRTPLGTLSLRHKSYARVAGGREAEARAWCLATDNEHLLTIQPTMLLGLLNYLVESGNVVPSFITVFTEETAVLTRKKE
jgi:hypothetical protein